MRQIDRHRRHHRARQRPAADLRAARAHSRVALERQPVERGDDPLGADAQIVVRRRAASRGRARPHRRANRRPPSLRAPTESACRSAARGRAARASARRRASCGGRDDAGLRTAEQLVAAEADEIHAVTKHFGGRRLVLETGDGLACRSSRRCRGPRRRRTRFFRASAAMSAVERRLHEAVHEEIAAVDFQDERRLARDGAGVVLERRLVRRADLAQPRAARLEHVRDPESAADLHQLAAGDDDLVRRRPGRNAAGSTPARRRCC